MPNFSVDADGRDQCFEDFVPGSVRTFGSVLVTEKEIVEFARHYDPQVFHSDPVAARKTVYGGPVASGWHTAAMAMRLIVEHYLCRVVSVGSPGVDEVRWLKPVRPGDRLSVRVEPQCTFGIPSTGPELRRVTMPLGCRAPARRGPLGLCEKELRKGSGKKVINKRTYPYA